MHTFLSQQNEVLRWIDEVTDQDVTRALVKDALNRSYRRVLSSRVWPFMKWPREETLTTVVGQKTYALKAGLNRILTLWDVQNFGWYPLIPRREWEAMAVDPSTPTDYPVGAIYGDTWPCAAQPSGAETLSVVSSSGSDTGVTLTLTGLDANGDVLTETVSATGTSPVTTASPFTYLTAITKSGTWVGTLTLSAPVAGTLLTLTPSQYSKQYMTLEFVETPQSVRSFIYTAQQMPRDLVYDNDIPATPFPYSEIHVYDALLDYTAYNTELATKEQRLWAARRDEVMKALEESVDENILGSRPRFVRNVDPVRRTLLVFP